MANNKNTNSAGTQDWIEASRDFHISVNLPDYTFATNILTSSAPDNTPSSVMITIEDDDKLFGTHLKELKDTIERKFFNK
jgi:hypothetical protein